MILKGTIAALCAAPYTKLDTSDRVLHKKWVGLTPTEFNSIKDNATTIGYAIIKTEAMLKEKNGG